MNHTEFDNDLYLQHVLDVATRCGTNPKIAKELGMSYNTFCNYMYKYEYFHDNNRCEFATQFVAAVYEGKYNYKINKLNKIKDTII